MGAYWIDFNILLCDNVSLALILAYWQYGLFPQTLNYSKWDLKAHSGLNFRLRPQFSSVTQSCLTLCNPMDFSTPGFLSITYSWSLLKLMSIKLVMPPNHLILCCLLLLLPSIFPSFRVFSKESVLRIRVAKVLELQFQHQSFQWIFRTDFL